MKNPENEQTTTNPKERYLDRIRSHDFARLLMKLPSNSYLDMALDPEMNRVSAPAVIEIEGEGLQLSVAEEKMADEARLVYVIWPIDPGCAYEDRYQL